MLVLLQMKLKMKIRIILLFQNKVSISILLFEMPTLIYLGFQPYSNFQS